MRWAKYKTPQPRCQSGYLVPGIPDPEGPPQLDPETLWPWGPSAVRLPGQHAQPRARPKPSVTHCRLVSMAAWGPVEPHFGFQGQSHMREEAGPPSGGKTHLDGVLELLVLPLKLLRLLQRAGRDEPGVQHGLTVADPAQHLKRYPGYPSSALPGAAWVPAVTRSKQQRGRVAHTSHMDPIARGLRPVRSV